MEITPTATAAPVARINCVGPIPGALPQALYFCAYGARCLRGHSSTLDETIKNPHATAEDKKTDLHGSNDGSGNRESRSPRIWGHTPLPQRGPSIPTASLFTLSPFYFSIQRIPLHPLLGAWGLFTSLLFSPRSPLGSHGRNLHKNTENCQNRPNYYQKRENNDKNLLN